MENNFNYELRFGGVRHTLLLLMMLMVSLSISGQAVKTNFDKKVLFTDSLNLPRNTSAATLITLLPELLQRPGNFLLSNYNIMIEGMSVGSAADVALYQLHTIDIERIEVSESPLSSYKNNGQGGSINIVLRVPVSERKDCWGSAGVVASSSMYVAPQFNLGYRKKDLMVRGIFLGEIQKGSGDYETSVYEGDRFTGQTNVSRDNRLGAQLARVYMQYDVTSRDKIRLDFSEIYTHNRSTTVTDHDDLSLLSQRQKSVNLQTHLNYRHMATRGTFTADVEYAHVPSWKDDNVTGVYKCRNDLKSNNLSGKLEYKILSNGKLKIENGKLKEKGRLSNGQLKIENGKLKEKGTTVMGELSLGMNFNATFGSETAHINDAKVWDEDVVRSVPRNDTYYVMPYMTFVTMIGKFGLKLSGEFQHFRYTFDRIGEPYSATSNDFTGKVMAEWHFSDLRNLRLILDRKLQRPAAEQMYPYHAFDPDIFRYVEGNPDLKPMMVHEAMVDYIGTYKMDNSQKLVFNVGASISSITDIISNKNSSSSSDSDLGASLEYLTFENRGSNTIASANVMALYTYKAFSLSFTGNLYHKDLDADCGDDHYTYYNLSLYPYFCLKDGWHGGARLVYYSRINQRNGSLGDCAVADMTVGKPINRFFIYLTESVSVMRTSCDVTKSGDRRTEKRYQMVPNNVSIGVKYSF